MHLRSRRCAKLVRQIPERSNFWLSNPKGMPSNSPLGEYIDRCIVRTGYFVGFIIKYLDNSY